MLTLARITKSPRMYQWAIPIALGTLLWGHAFSRENQIQLAFFTPLQMGTIAALLLGVAIMVLYRRTVSNEYEPVPVALTLIGLIDTSIITMSKEQISVDSVLVLVLFVFNSFFLIAIFRQQRDLQDELIEEILIDPSNLASGVTPGDPRIRPWIDMGRHVIDVDVYPDAPLEQFLGSRRKRRSTLYNNLPSNIFEKSNFSADSFIIPPSKAVWVRVMYASASWNSLVGISYVIFALN